MKSTVPKSIGEKQGATSRAITEAKRATGSSERKDIEVNIKA